MTNSRHWWTCQSRTFVVCTSQGNGCSSKDWHDNKQKIAILFAWWMDVPPRIFLQRHTRRLWCKESKWHFKKSDTRKVSVRAVVYERVLSTHGTCLRREKGKINENNYRYLFSNCLEMKQRNLNWVLGKAEVDVFINVCLQALQRSSCIFSRLLLFLWIHL